ncbi:sensor histidine kinase [Lacticaseibacillus daqingensis]|uniref:sensor histidine kinase n=1 Tax=Lacticaseibacillus daqingensis TaxID=2486014 RepID=UPI000F7B959D|nr:HAMP domain-containing sensor histidine kinase [Lacticaseibacillus daqingensis]
MSKPEARLILQLAVALGGVLMAVCLLAWRAAPLAGVGLLVLWGIGVALIGVVCGLWLRRLHRDLAAIEAQLHAARMGHAEYAIGQNDEGAFSALHNELHHYVRQTTALRADLQRDRDRLSTAITDIAHQLRTPIAVQGNLVELLTPANAATTRAELLRQNERLAHLVAQLILLARVDTHTLSQVRTRVSVDTLLRQSLTPLAPVAADRGVTLDWQVPVGLQVHVNVKLMQEALINLFKNTLEHAPADSTVTVQASGTPISVVVTLTNTGAPIPPSDLPHVFERFYRGSQSAAGNVGIGLAIAQGIVTAGAGRLSVANVTGGVQVRVEWFQAPAAADPQ